MIVLFLVVAVEILVVATSVKISEIVMREPTGRLIRERVEVLVALS